MRASSPVRPAPLSQAPGQRMRVPSSCGGRVGAGGEDGVQVRGEEDDGGFVAAT